MIRTILLLSFGATLLAMAVTSLRRQRLKERYALLFVFTGIPFFILAAWPDGVLFLSRTLAIEKATIITLSVTAFVILILFQLLSIVSVQDRRIATLSQMVAILIERTQPKTDSPQSVDTTGDPGPPAICTPPTAKTPSESESVD